VLNHNCINGKSGNCHWVIESAVIAFPATDTAFGADFENLDLVYVGGPAVCGNGNPHCTWTFINGMIVSDVDRQLALNAFGGAVVGAPIKVDVDCDATTPDGRWRLQSNGLFSDASTLAVVPAADGESLTLAEGCKSSSCKVGLPASGCGGHGQPSCDGVTCLDTQVEHYGNLPPQDDGYCHDFDHLTGSLMDGLSWRSQGTADKDPFQVEIGGKAGLFNQFKFTLNNTFRDIPMRLDLAQFKVNVNGLTCSQWSSAPASFTFYAGTSYVQTLGCAVGASDFDVLLIYSL